MYLKVIVIVTVFYNAITLVKTSDDVLVIDPRDLRLFESVWKLGVSSRNSPPKAPKSIPIFNPNIQPVYKISSTPPPVTEKVDFYSVGDDDFHNYKTTVPADGKFLRKMFTPKYSEKYFGPQKNFETRNLFSTIASNEIAVTTPMWGKNDDDVVMSTRKPRAKKVKKYKYKQREFDDKESYIR